METTVNIHNEWVTRLIELLALSWGRKVIGFLLYIRARIRLVWHELLKNYALVIVRDLVTGMILP